MAWSTGIEGGGGWLSTQWAIASRSSISLKMAVHDVEEATKLKWFGEAWGPICNVAEQVPVPAGEKCSDCDEEIGPQDKGVVMPHVDTITTELPMHHECLIRSIFGGLAHQLRTCSCYGAGVEMIKLTRP